MHGWNPRSNDDRKTTTARKEEQCPDSVKNLFRSQQG